MIGFNGGLIGKTRATTLDSSVPGIWTLPEQIEAKRNLKWPSSEGILSTGLILHLDAGLTSSYPGSGTTWTDISGSGNNGTIVGSPTFEATDGGRFSFNGSNTVEFRLISTATSNITIQSWVNFSSTSKTGSFFLNGNTSGGYGMGVGSGGTWTGTGNTIYGLYSGVRWINGATGYGTGWKFVTLTIDSTGLPFIYVNNTLIGSFSGSSPNTPAGITFMGANNFNGIIAQTYMYNIYFSQSAVTSNYNATKTRYGL